MTKSSDNNRRPDEPATWRDLQRLRSEFEIVLMALVDEDRVVSEMRAALASGSGQQMACEVLTELDPRYTESLLNEVFHVAVDSTDARLEAITALARLTVETVRERIPPLVERVLSDPQSDYWHWTSAANVLKLLDMRDLLNEVLGRAGASQDPDIRDIVDLDWGDSRT